VWTVGSVFWANADDTAMSVMERKMLRGILTPWMDDEIVMGRLGWLDSTVFATHGNAKLLMLRRG
jgi:hypothetical protein